MTVMRPIHEHESTSYLNLLCEVFSIDRHRAEGVFYNEPGFDLNRKWALFESGHMISILTTNPLQFGPYSGMGIAGVGTLESYRGKGHAANLIRAALDHGDRHGEHFALLFAQVPEVYESCGFQVIDDVVQGPIRSSGAMLTEDVLGHEEVADIYERWAESSSSRLTRTELRWRIWQWGLRSCEPQGDGYICYEGLTVREAIMPKDLDAWPVPPKTDWIGLSSLTESLGVPMDGKPMGMKLMGRNLSFRPEFFMTDQF